MNEEVYNADKELAISGKHGTDPQRNPAPRAALFSLFTDTDASFSVRRSTAAFRASKSAPLMGNMPAHHITAQRLIACCSNGFKIAALRASESAPLIGNIPAHHINTQYIIACCSDGSEIAASRASKSVPRMETCLHTTSPLNT
jgi:hypothetical protein